MKYNTNELYDLTYYAPQTQKDLTRLLDISDKIGSFLDKSEINLMIDLIIGGCGYEVSCALDTQIHPTRYKHALKTSFVENF